MTRITVLALPAHADWVRGQLELLAAGDARLVSAPDDIPWRDTDVLWSHGVCATPAPLLPWIDSGGRLLATLDAALIPAAVGLESSPPDEVRNARWDSGPHAPRGLAAFGPHPLFEGLPQGALTLQPRPGGEDRLVGYQVARPLEGLVVAVAWDGSAVDPSRLVAWEYPVGNGGILCVGAGLSPEGSGGPYAAEVLTLLRNALHGLGVPTGPRGRAVRHWPHVGGRVTREDAATLRGLPGSADWPGGASAPILDALGDVPGDWVLAGRRGLFCGMTAAGLRESWLHPFRVVRDASLMVGGALPATVTVRETPADVARTSHSGSVEVRERWLAALEHPVLCWEVQASEAVPLIMEWTSDLRRASPYPPGCAGDLHLTMAADGRSAALSAEADPFRLLVEVEGGVLDATPVDGPAVRFTVRAAGRCLLRFSAAADTADDDRTRQAFERRGTAGLWSQRRDHARELAAYATSLECPEPALAQAVEWAKVRMDAALTGVPGVGRSLAVNAPEVRFDAAKACLIGMAQLALGDRGAPRDALKFLSLTQGPGGRVVADCSPSGLGELDRGAVAPLYLLLAARYAAWTGELDFLAHRWAALRRTLDAGLVAEPWREAEVGPWREALGALQPLAEALGHPEVSEVLAERAAELPMGSGQAPPPAIWAWAGASDGPAGAAALERWRAFARQVRDSGGRDLLDAARGGAAAVLGCWGVRPNALEGAVRLAPWLPPGWDAMSLDRLRVGKTVLSVRLRRRFGQVAARVERVHGPRIHVEFVLRGGPGGPVLLDDEELAGGRASFEADGSHALVWAG